MPPIVCLWLLRAIEHLRKLFVVLPNVSLQFVRLYYKDMIKRVMDGHTQ